tara:strand:- start:746 stop:964 length:219 start_codon:yes stop_codon:yes gene_type:complete
MPCACGNRGNSNNIETIITKKNIVTQHVFHKKTKEDKLQILKNYISTKPFHVRNDRQFQINMVNLYKSILSD